MTGFFFFFFKELPHHLVTGHIIRVQASAILPCDTSLILGGRNVC